MLINKLEELLNNSTPFSFSRFNDGEIGGIVEAGFIASRGAQKVDQKLKGKLIEAITYKQVNYWVGIPCSVCYPAYSKVANELVGEYEYKTLAVDLINKNYNLTKDIFKRTLVGKEVYWVGGEDQIVEKVKQEYNFNLVKQYKLPNTNCFDYYDSILEEVGNFKDGSIVILSLGPLERVLVKEWFGRNNKITFLGLGSFFDPMTRNITHGYHNGTTNKCEICN